MPGGSSGGRQSGGDGNTALIVTIVVFGVLLAGIAIAGATNSAMQGYALVAFAVVAALMPVSVILARRRGGSSDSIERRIMELTGAVHTMTQEGGLSEVAKRVLHRRQERELLRRAIEQDIADEDWEAAMVLVKELAERFGYRGDAEEFRARIERARAATFDREVIEAMTMLDDLIRAGRWTEAYTEAARITRIYPDSPRVGDLRDRVEQARLRHRKDLERRFLMAAQREHVDEAMGLLKELDTYLTPTEAEPFQEVARGVIGKSRENLGVRFKLMVQDHQWQAAVEVGEQIINQFPNTRMAQEVRDMLPALREKSMGMMRTGAGARG